MSNELSIGIKIAELRKESKLSQAQFADMMTVSPQAVSKWERGESLPDIITLDKMAAMFGKTLNYFSSMSFNEGIAKDTVPRKVFDMSMAEWRDADFSGLENLSEKFKGANVINCKFCSCGLSGIVFKGNNIKNCDFSGADLSQSRFSMCNIPDNKFIGCNFKNAAVSVCSLNGSAFCGADFSGSVFSGSALTKCNVSGAIFNNTEFKNSTFDGIVINSDITGCQFNGCSFKRSEFKDVTFTDTFFKNMRLKKAVFTNCKADRITYAFLKNAKADMGGIELIDG